MCAFLLLSYWFFPFSLRLPFGCQRLWPFSNSIILQFDFVLNLLCCLATTQRDAHHAGRPFFLSPTSIVLMCLWFLFASLFVTSSTCSFFGCATFLHFFKWHFHFKFIFAATKLHLRVISAANTCHRALTTPGSRTAMHPCREDTFLLKHYWYAMGHVGRIGCTLVAHLLHIMPELG